MRKGDVYTLFCLYVLQQIMQNKRINRVLLPGRLTVIGLWWYIQKDPFLKFELDFSLPSSVLKASSDVPSLRIKNAWRGSKSVCMGGSLAFCSSCIYGKITPPPHSSPSHTHTLLSKPCSHMTILKKYIETASLVTCTNLSLRFTFKLPHVYFQNKRTIVHRITKSLKPWSNVKLNLWWT